MTRENEAMKSGSSVGEGKRSCCWRRRWGTKRAETTKRFEKVAFSYGKYSLKYSAPLDPQFLVKRSIKGGEKEATECAWRNERAKEEAKK
jgi:hypothetical protein